ncbi:MAG: hypothetical protein ACPGFA_10635 [Pikeienuella sp.]
MTDWRSGLMLRTFLRLGLRVPFVIALVIGFVWLMPKLVLYWMSVLRRDGGELDTLWGVSSLALLNVALCLALVLLTIMTMRRPLWERHTESLLGLFRGLLFGFLVLVACLLIAGVLIAGTVMIAPLDETPRGFRFLHRTGLIAILLLCTSPGLFALVVSIRERQGYSTIARIWRIDRAQTIRGVFLIMVLTSCVAAVTIVGTSISVRGAQVGLIWLGTDIEWITNLDFQQRALISGVVTVIAFTTAHIIQYERIRDWESGGDVSGVFD